MKQKGQPAENAQPMKKWVVILLAVVCVLLMGVCVLLLGGRNTQPQPPVPEDETPKIKYAEGVTAVEDPEALQKAVAEMYEQARQPGMGLEYRNDATSTDGQTFSCYIANATRNTYDMYIDIYSDAQLTDEIFLSGLLRPGTAFDEIKLDEPLETGTHRVYVAFTQVEEDLETIHAQIVVTMDFTVTE